MINDFDEPDGAQAADPVEAAWELWNDLRHRDEFRNLTMSQWSRTGAPRAALLIGQGWTVQELYGRLTSQLPAQGVGRPEVFVSGRLAGLDGVR